MRGKAWTHTATRVVILLLWFGCQREPVVSLEEAAAEAVATDPEARRQEIVARLRGLVADLGAAGRYDCCIKIPCLHCAQRSGGCACGEGLRRGEPVCEECALMWLKGQGDEPGVDPACVRSFLEAERAMGEGRAPLPCGAMAEYPPPSQ